jgi:hypothetical protein
VFQAAALQVRIELLLDVVRQWSACFGTHLPKLHGLELTPPARDVPQVQGAQPGVSSRGAPPSARSRR